ncbi:MAG TPA: hypothetical protein VH518_10240, partial [Tepidisphaeraceae bacterium]
MRKRDALLRCVAVMGPLLSVGSAVRGQTPTFSGSGNTATWTHDLDVSTGTDGAPFKVGVNNPPASSTVGSPPAYQINRPNITLPGSTTDKSSAYGWVGHLENQTQAGLKIATGTGVTQSDPANSTSFAGSSSLRLDISRYNWTTSPSVNFGPFAQAYFSNVMSVTIPSGSAGLFSASIDFQNGSGVSILTAPISFINKPLPSPSVNQIVSFTDQKMFNTVAGLGVVGTNQTIRMVGFIEIKTKNDAGPVKVTLDTAEMSAAPPTATFVQSGDWLAASNWSSDANSDGLPSDTIPGGVPNHPGDRARFVGNFGPASLDLGTNVTIGMLDVDGQSVNAGAPDSLTIGGGGAAQLTLSAPSSSFSGAVIHLDHVYGNPSVNLNVPVQLAVPTDVINDSTGAIKFSQSVSGASIDKSGTGPMLIHDASLGNLTVHAGAVAITGSASISNSTFAPGATLAGGTGVLSGSVSLQSGSALSPGGPRNVGTVAVNGNLNVDSALWQFDLSNIQTVGGGTNDYATVNGSVQLNGISTLSINRTAGSLSAGTYTLMQYSGTLSGGAGNFLLPQTRQLLAIDTSSAPGAIMLVVGAGSIGNLVWSGLAGNTWENPALGTWNNGAVPDRFFQWDNVTFDDTSTVGSVVINGQVTPGTMQINNDIFSYVIGGPGSIVDAPSLVKTGTGGATLAMAGGASIGSVVVNGGVLTIANNSAFGATTINAGGTMRIGGGSFGVGTIGSGPVLVNGGVLAFNRQDSIVVSNLISGNGTVQNMSGTTQFDRVQVGNLNISGGTVTISQKPSPNHPSGTSVVHSLTIGAGGHMDLTNNSMVIDYTGAATPTLNSVRQSLSSGRLFNSVTDFNARLGYADNATLQLSTFAGVSVDTSSVLIKYTFTGDADLDGDADGVDIGTWATNFTGELGGTGSAIWSQGDFDYDGDVD